MPVKRASDRFRVCSPRITSICSPSHVRPSIINFAHLSHLYRSNQSRAYHSPPLFTLTTSNMDRLSGMGSNLVNQTVQKTEETPMEAECRKMAEFSKYEQALDFRKPSLSSWDIIGHVTGLLGSKNPFGKNAKANEHEVWLLDNTAYKTGSDAEHPKWEAEFVACYFQKGRKDITQFVSHVADTIGLDGKTGSDAATRELIAQRLQPFISSIAPARTIDIAIPSSSGPPQKRTLGPSNANGISSQLVATGGNDAADGTTIVSTNAGASFPPVNGKTRFAGPEGWAIISDIDDTIKVTQTPNPIGILRTTFAEEPKTTQGMPEFYSRLDEQFENPAWFYLSASPYNLYPFLHQFIEDNYKPGTMILRDSSWMYFGGVLASLTQGTQAYKTSRIAKIHDWLPTRKFICIGDSTQSDPESYAEMYKKYPGWIKAIYIRKVVDAPYMDEKNKPERFEDAFKDVPEHVWRLFITPDELADHVKHLVDEAHTGVSGAVSRY